MAALHGSGTAVCNHELVKDCYALRLRWQRVPAVGTHALQPETLEVVASIPMKLLAASARSREAALAAVHATSSLASSISPLDCPIAARVRVLQDSAAAQLQTWLKVAQQQEAAHERHDTTSTALLKLIHQELSDELVAAETNSTALLDALGVHTDARRLLREAVCDSACAPLLAWRRDCEEVEALLKCLGRSLAAAEAAEEICVAWIASGNARSIFPPGALQQALVHMLQKYGAYSHLRRG